MHKGQTRRGLQYTTTKKKTTCFVLYLFVKNFQLMTCKIGIHFLWQELYAIYSSNHFLRNGIRPISLTFDLNFKKIIFSILLTNSIDKSIKYYFIWSIDNYQLIINIFPLSPVYPILANSLIVNTINSYWMFSFVLLLM